MNEDKEKNNTSEDSALKNKHNLRMKKITINTDLDLMDENAVKVESKDVEVSDSEVEQEEENFFHDKKFVQRLNKKPSSDKNDDNDKHESSENISSNDDSESSENNNQTDSLRLNKSMSESEEKKNSEEKDEEDSEEK